MRNFIELSFPSEMSHEMSFSPVQYILIAIDSDLDSNG